MGAADGVLFDDPHLPEGWTRKCVKRSTGASAGKWDVYVYNPMGKKFRSQNEVRQYLQQIGSDLDADVFSFNAYTVGASARSAVNKQKLAPSVKKTLNKPKQLKPESKSKKIHLKFNFSKQRVKKHVVAKVPLTPAKQKKWLPPKSPYGLLQEVYASDPWKLLLSTILIGKAYDYRKNMLLSDDDLDNEENYEVPIEKLEKVGAIIKQLLKQWPEPLAMRDADPKLVAELLDGFGDDQIANQIVRFTDEYISKTWKYPKELYGIGRLGNDSYRLFCLGEWKHVKPYDVMLSLYHNWLWTNYKALGLC